MTHEMGATSLARDPTLGKRLRRRAHESFGMKLSYGFRVGAGYVWDRLTRRMPAKAGHLLIALADHFEPAFMPQKSLARAFYDEQEGRIESWCRAYPRAAYDGRDSEGRPFVHTYFYPAEQYDRGLVARLAEHCKAGWGEIEVHLHHGVQTPDNAENTRRQLVSFRDTLAEEHGCLSYLDGFGMPRYAFVHGNFALANSAGGRGCGVDSEMQILADTGCYADMTLPTAVPHPAQTAKINSLYECKLPLWSRAPQRRGRDLESGRAPRAFPLIIQGPLMIVLSPRSSRLLSIENGAVTGRNPLSVPRLEVCKRAAIHVKGRPDWRFIKLHCHGMDPRQQEALLGAPFTRFLSDLIENARQRGDTLHFVTAREMVNIMFAACDGRDGNPGQYRDYRLKRVQATSFDPRYVDDATVRAKG